MRFAGFALLAAGLAFVFHAYSPSKFDTSRPTVSNDSERHTGAAGGEIKLTRNFSIDAGLVRAPAGDWPAERAEIASAAGAAAPALAVQVNLPQTASVPAIVQPARDDIGNTASIVRSIKRELRRVGCYDGRIDGEWDRASRAAMGAFIDRVNATLPSREPDVVLLTLVRNHRAVACGASCPSGQAMGGDGQCLPNAIIAKAKRKALVTVAQNMPSAKPFETTVSFNEMKPTAATLPPPRAPVHTATKTASRPAPLPGRMTVGGPGTTTASPAPPEKSWWDNFIGTATDTRDAPREQTLDRPVGLTQVPQPRLVRQSPTGAAAPIRQASLEEMPATDGMGDGTALLAPAARSQALITPAQKATSRPSRKVARKAPRQKEQRRWSGRNVQAMFQHPLGRL